MLKILVAAGLVACLLCAGLSGCTWMGRTTGSAVRGVAESADEFKKGYDQGYGVDQNKPAQPAPAQAEDTKKDSKKQ